VTGRRDPSPLEGCLKRATKIAALMLCVIFALPQNLLPFGKNKVVYDDFKWKIYHSTHFDVYFYEEERPALQRVVNFAESAYDDLSRKFNFQIPKKVPLIFYATHSAFEQTNVELMFIPEGIGAFAEPVRNRMVMPIDMSDEELLQLITHELTHIFEYEILFQGKFGRELASSPPTWFMEGLASFMAQDEDTSDRMVLRDAVVNDNLPSITQPFGGFFAYRFGHAVFRFIVEKWGWDGLRDFIYEYRNSLGNSIEKPMKRAFDIKPEEFDTRFRTWLRKQYLPALITKGEPSEYGEKFTVMEGRYSQEMSGVPSPSGDLLVAITTFKEDVDLALMNVPERKLIRNLTRGLPDRYEYITAQYLTTGPTMGRDVAFSPNGDHIAVFVKRSRGRYLMIINALSGEIEKMIDVKVEQPLSPSYSPDGRKIAFHGFEGNQADIFVYDIEANAFTNITKDPFFDGAPVFSPDGRGLIYSSVVDSNAKLFRLDLADPSKRYQLTTGAWNDIDAYFTPDGKKLFFSSDRQTGRNVIEAAALLERDENLSKREGDTPPPDLSNYAAYNVYSLDFGTGQVMQYTDVVGGAFTPVVFTSTGGAERFAFSSFYKGRWQLYTALTDKPLRLAETIAVPSAPIGGETRQPFLPPVEVAIDEEKIDNYDSLRMFIDDVSINAGVNSDQTLVSRSTIFMSDMLGNRRFIASLDSVSTFSNFDFLYLDLTDRLTWGGRLFDDRTYYVTQNTGQVERFRRLYRQTGVAGILSYPFDLYHRVDTGIGYMSRDIAYPVPIKGENGEPVLDFVKFEDEFPFASASFTGDSAIFRSFGPVTGRRYEVSAAYAHDTKNSGALSTDYTLDFRQYMQVTSRSVLAGRLFAGYSDGNRPNFYYFGGLNTLRGYDFRTIIGTRAFFANVEYRFPLIDVIATPLIAISQVRGNIFFDVGGAYFQGDDFTFQKDGRLQDAKGSFGYGVSMNLFGMELHWDIARRIHDEDDKAQTTFWVGDTF
jgi:hypothetical protein